MRPGPSHRPQTELRKGNVFTPVCQSFCSQGGCIPACIGADNPPRQIPPCPVHAGIHNPLPHPVHAGIPPLPPQQPLLRTVRILLEYILVLSNFRNVILEGTICCDNFIYIIFRFGNSLITVSPQNILQTTRSFLLLL